ncbi:MAG TPA: PKD domain-containing protein [Anaerolineales bacterium]|nr:PKD domain-containing protein [Anaerolineales bacterium]
MLHCECHNRAGQDIPSSRKDVNLQEGSALRWALPFIIKLSVGNYTLTFKCRFPHPSLVPILHFRINKKDGAANGPPTAVAGGPYLAAVGEKIAFDGLGSSDPDGDALTETWTADSGTVADKTYIAGAEAGIYDVCLTVNDGTVDSDSGCTMVVVYDPSAGFVTGGGWIDSPAGAYKADETLSGKATFGFVAKNKKGVTVPDGNTEFQFKAGALNFKSTSYEWLVFAGSAAQFKGEGTISGEGSYSFRIWADNGATDTFRIQIWDANGNVYDNRAQQSLGGGSIKVHH